MTALKLDEMPASLDEVLMRQAFTNLIQNAVEAMPDGGTLAVETRVGREIAVTVRDTGIGISGDDLRKVFLPFYTTRTRASGSVSRAQDHTLSWRADRGGQREGKRNRIQGDASNEVRADG
jgi:signal transduction histidine kinase